MADKQVPSPELLRKLLRYEPLTGKLYWRERNADSFSNAGNGRTANTSSWNVRFAGKEAFALLCGEGYNRGKLMGANYFAHRIIWAIVHDEWPKEQIDHKNHIRTDNRITNLRVVTNKENCKNRTIRRRHASGFYGVNWNKRDKRWISRIYINGECIHLGSFIDKQDAIDAREAANVKYGFHINHGAK